jgi:hypothetical protein
MRFCKENILFDFFYCDLQVSKKISLMNYRIENRFQNVNNYLTVKMRKRINQCKLNISDGSYFASGTK